MGKLIAMIAVLGIGGLAAAQAPEIRRYLKMKAM
jgi:hypothetical protein